MRRFFFVILFGVLLINQANSEEGVASIYGTEHGQSRRADGKAYHPYSIGCAHKTRPLGSVVRVTVIATGRSISCVINDHGPYVRGRIIDLSLGAARALGIKGLARVRIN